MPCRRRRVILARLALTLVQLGRGAGGRGAAIRWDGAGEGIGRVCGAGQCERGRRETDLVD